MIRIYIGTPDSSDEITVNENADTIKSVYERGGKADLLLRDKIVVKVMGSQSAQIKKEDWTKTLADLHISDEDYVVVSENLKGARN